MKYVVFDMEWNQTYGCERRLPYGRTLTGEIIEIGAVRLDEDFRAEDSFKVYVRPVYYKKLHSMVRRLTGITADLLREEGVTFREAYERFLAFCGDDFVTMTWGDSDLPVLRENIDAHSLPAWRAKNYTLQSVYMRKVGSKNCISLETVAEALGFNDETIRYHDAGCDAAVTARILELVDLRREIAEYRAPIGDLFETDVLSYKEITDVVNLQKLRADPRIRFTPCPDCGRRLEALRIIPQGNGKKIAVIECPEHGKYLLRLRTSHVKDDTFTVSKYVYGWSDEAEELYRDRLEIAERKKEKFLARVRRKKKKPEQPPETKE